MLFIDTCYLLSLINVKAKNHEKAQLLSQYIGEEETLINSTVLLEMRGEDECTWRRVI